MRYGFVIPGGSATEQLELAVLAEASGWEGVFVPEGGFFIDPWAMLTGVAMRTQRIRLGTMLTPLPWRRPWKLAAQVATLDQLSGGRAILGVGLGAVDTGLGDYGEVTDRKERGELLDEGIDLVAALWAGEQEYEGRHNRLKLTAFENPGARPVQQPRVPIWCVGAFGRTKSMQRVVRCDGLIPTTIDENGVRQSTPAELIEMVGWLDDHGGRRPGFDVIVEGETDVETVHEVTAPWADAGATWWLESRWTATDPTEVRRRIEMGPVPSKR